MMGIPKEVYEKLYSGTKQLAQEMLDVMHPMTPRYQGHHQRCSDASREEISWEYLCPVLIMHARD